MAKVMKQIAAFLRSILPADPFQLLFLAGLTCLTIAPHLRWWPMAQSDQWSAKLNGSPIWMEYYVVLVAATYGFILASSAGYFLCLWPGKRSIIKVWVTVFFPSAVSAVLIAVKFLSIRAEGYSVLSQVHGMNSGYSWALRELWLLGSGMHFAILGICLTAIFALRMLSGHSHLPLCLASSAAIGDTPQPGWDGSKRLIWFWVAAIASVITAAVGVGLLSPLLLTSAYKNPRAWMGFLEGFVGATVMLVITMWLAGSENRKEAYRLVRWASPKMVFVGAVLPALVTVVPSMARYLFDRVHWAAYDFGRYSPPSLTSYLPTLQIWTLSLIFSAFAEEVIFRGVLQRHFVSRLGVWRGIFLTGIVWAAFHFPGDTYSASSDQQIIFGLLHRIAQCLILGFVLSWLTLRSGSLLPPTLAHWLSNVGVYSARSVSQLSTNPRIK